jgi:hypothetical protein
MRPLKANPTLRPCPELTLLNTLALTNPISKPRRTGLKYRSSTTFHELSDLARVRVRFGFGFGFGFGPGSGSGSGFGSGFGLRPGVG